MRSGTFATISPSLFERKYDANRSTLDGTTLSTPVCRKNLARYSINFFFFFQLNLIRARDRGQVLTFRSNPFFPRNTTRIRLEVIRRLLFQLRNTGTLRIQCPACRWNFRNHHSTSYAAAVATTTTTTTTTTITAIDITTIANIILENVISVFWDNFRTIGKMKRMEQKKEDGR